MNWAPGTERLMRLGSHLSVAGGVAEALRSAEELALDRTGHQAAEPAAGVGAHHHDVGAALVRGVDDRARRIADVAQ